MHTLKLSIYIGLLSSYLVLGLVRDANAVIEFNGPDFYNDGVFTNADFRPGDDNYYFTNDYGYYPNYYDNYAFPNDYGYYQNYYQMNLMYPEYTVVNENGYYRDLNDDEWY